MLNIIMNSLILVTNIILGAILLFSYYYLASKNPGEIDKLWGNIKGDVRNLYKVSIILAGIGYVYMLYFLVFKVKNNRELLNKILLFQIILIVISMLWMPISLNYLTNKHVYSKFLIIFIVFIVGIAALGNAVNIYKLDVPSKNKTGKIMALTGAGYLFFQTFVMDFLSWTYNFF
jgi:hypothetical protein